MNNRTSKCTENSQLLADPDSFKLACHIMTGFAIPIHFYGMWCILFKTSSMMLSVKRLLLWTHCLGALLDLSLSYLSMPYLLFPTFSGYSLGQMNMPELQIYIEMSLAALMCTSILSIYENRYFVLFGKNENPRWNRIRMYFLTFNYILAVTFIAPNYIFCPEQTIAVKIITERLPCTPEHSINNRNLFVAALDLNFTFFCLTFETFLLFIEVATFFFIVSVRLMYRGQRKMSLMSNRTHSLQKKFVMALCFQSTVPFVLIVVPIVYVLATLRLNYHNQLLTNICVLIGSSHGIVATIVMVLIHKSYRDATLDLIYSCCVRKNWKIGSRKISTNVSPVNRVMKF
ncbi:hypothetical protein GCK72_018958 [Caenorhabditis remanei]|uniref:Serpentine Receptor, class H n=1 Tax=Caenorhabditis remanei TaxID=31234 RepID=A0A6A5GCL2_CAERE|nr:hypothetical protein GCK72_018958 [Caenorhabditis remanei]KAF1752403.1 hypothetical protein GCK72_018958 [Caenorhabditis remanei]